MVSQVSLDNYPDDPADGDPIPPVGPPHPVPPESDAETSSAEEQDSDAPDDGDPIPPVGPPHPVPPDEGEGS